MNNKPINILTLLRSEEGYLLIVVTMIGLILAILFGYILPDLHYGQMTRAINNLNEQRAYEAARKGINAVRLGIRDVHNFQELIGYAITGVNQGSKKFTISGNYASLFASGDSLQVYYSTGNDGTYTVSSASNVITPSYETEIVVTEAVPNATDDGVICRSRGILWAIDQLCGATTTSTNHAEYKDEEGNVQFISGCQGINVDTNEKGMLHISIIVSRGGVINYTDGDPDPKNDCLYFYNNGALGTTNGSPILSEDNDTSGGITWTDYDYPISTVRYGDFDLDGSANYDETADFKYLYSGGQWSFSIGNNGAWRGDIGGTELWNLQKTFSSGDGDAPFQGKDNDGDGDIDDNDKIEVFIIVRSTGITVAPGDPYPPYNSLRLVNEANSHLPNPMRQVLEVGFF